MDTATAITKVLGEFQRAGRLSASQAAALRKELPLALARAGVGEIRTLQKRRASMRSEEYQEKLAKLNRQLDRILELAVPEIMKALRDGGPENIRKALTSVMGTGRGKLQKVPRAATLRKDAGQATSPADAVTLNAAAVAIAAQFNRSAADVGEALETELGKTPISQPFSQALENASASVTGQIIAGLA